MSCRRGGCFFLIGRSWGGLIFCTGCPRCTESGVSGETIGGGRRGFFWCGGQSLSRCGFVFSLFDLTNGGEGLDIFVADGLGQEGTQGEVGDFFEELGVGFLAEIVSGQGEEIGGFAVFEVLEGTEVAEVAFFVDILEPVFGGAVGSEVFQYVTEDLGGFVGEAEELEATEEVINEVADEDGFAFGDGIGDDFDVVSEDVGYGDGHIADFEDEFVVAFDFTDEAFVTGEGAVEDLDAVVVLELAVGAVQEGELAVGAFGEELEAFHFGIGDGHGTADFTQGIELEVALGGLDGHELTQKGEVGAYKEVAGDEGGVTGEALAGKGDEALLHGKEGFPYVGLGIKALLDVALYAGGGMDDIPVYLLHRCWSFSVIVARIFLSHTDFLPHADFRDLKDCFTKRGKRRRLWA